MFGFRRSGHIYVVVIYVAVKANPWMDQEKSTETRIVKKIKEYGSLKKAKKQEGIPILSPLKCLQITE